MLCVMLVNLYNIDVYNMRINIPLKNSRRSHRELCAKLNPKCGQLNSVWQRPAHS